MNRLAAALALALALAGARGTALAQRSDAIFDPLTMDSYTPMSKLDVEFSYVKYEPDTFDEPTVIGFAVSGQYIALQGLGGYVTLPLSYLDADEALDPIFGDDSELAIGNLELGGIWSKYVSPRAAVVLHAGIALPTASDDGIAQFQALASSPRYGDFVQRVPESSWLRIGVSPMGRSGILFWRADIGIDLALQEDGPIEYSPVFRINLGGGLDLGSAHLQAEFVTDIVDTGADDEVASTFALGARFLSGNLRPGVALLLPVDFQGQVLEPDFAIAFSLSARL